MALETDLQSMDDATLVAACREGSEPAWGEFVHRFSRLIYAAARRRGLSDADSEEVLQHTMETAWKHLHAMREPAAVRSWLLTTAMRECWRVWQASAKAPRSVDAVEEPRRLDPDEVDRLERQHLVRRGLDELGEPCRALLLAIFNRSEGERYADVAERLGLPVGSLGPTRGRCFRKLESILARLGLTA